MCLLLYERVSIPPLLILFPILCPMTIFHLLFVALPCLFPQSLFVRTTKKHFSFLIGRRLWMMKWKHWYLMVLGTWLLALQIPTLSLVDECSLLSTSLMGLSTGTRLIWLLVATLRHVALTMQRLLTCCSPEFYTSSSVYCHKSVMGSLSA